MEPINSRVIDIRKHLRLTQTKFAQEIGITSQAVNMIEAGKSVLTEANIRLICLTFKVNEQWLRYGTGEMINNEAVSTDKEKRLLDLFMKLSPRAQDLAIEYVEKVLSDEKTLRGEAEAEKGEKSG